jgi:hypothetical protein
MQNLFNKLSSNDKRIFLLKNILNDEYFKDIHQIINDKYSNYTNTNINNEEQNMTNNIIKYLYKYNQAIKECYIDQSRYKDLVLNVFDMKDNIEQCMSSKYINGIDSNGKSIFDIMITNYEETKDFIEYKYGGAVDGEDNDQSLSSALKILFNNPHLDKKFKKYKYYKDNYKRINSLQDDNVREYTYDK